MFPSSVLFGVRSPKPNSPPGDEDPTDGRPTVLELLRGIFLAACRAEKDKAHVYIHIQVLKLNISHALHITFISLLMWDVRNI